MYSSLLLLSQLSNHLIQTSLKRFKEKRASLPLPLFSSYFHCLLYIAKAADYSTQYILLLENPYLAETTFIERVSFCSSPVQHLLQFCYDVLAWENEGNTATNAWTLPKEVIASVVMIQKYLAENAYKGDPLWERNMGIRVACGKCVEIQTLVYLMEYLLQTQTHLLKQQDGMSEELIAGIESLNALFSSCVSTVDVLAHKLHSLQQKIKDDGFCGIPLLDRTEEAQHLVEKSQLNCIDNHTLWDYMEVLKRIILLSIIMYRRVYEGSGVLSHVGAPSKVKNRFVTIQSKR